MKTRGTSFVGVMVAGGTNTAPVACGVVYISGASPDPRGDDLYASWSIFENINAGFSPLNTGYHKRPSSRGSLRTLAKILYFRGRIDPDRAVTEYRLVIRDYVVSRRSIERSMWNLFRPASDGTRGYS